MLEHTYNPPQYAHKCYTSTVHMKTNTLRAELK